jgi:hypothetical protein
MWKEVKIKMKKILSLLTLFIIAVSNNLSPVQSEDIPFTEGSYYSGQYHTETDYKGMYSTYVGEKVSVDDACNTTPVAPKNPTYRKSEKGVLWFILEGNTELSTLLSKEEKETLINARDGNTIVAPFRVKIISSANASNHGHKMVVESIGGDFRITFDNMARWYCCIGRKPKSDYTHDFTMTEDAKGQVLSSGDIIGLATKETTVSIEKKSDGTYTEISTYDLYNSND